MINVVVASSRSRSYIITCKLVVCPPRLEGVPVATTASFTYSVPAIAASAASAVSIAHCGAKSASQYNVSIGSMVSAQESTSIGTNPWKSSVIEVGCTISDKNEIL